MSIDQWDNQFQPINNSFDEHASFNGIMFETYGDELKFVIDQPNNTIWTLIDGDQGAAVIVSGYHLVNRIGYFVTAMPWVDPMTVTLD